jgi:hypothetical protein
LIINNKEDSNDLHNKIDRNLKIPQIWAKDIWT